MTVRFNDDVEFSLRHEQRRNRPMAVASPGHRLRLSGKHGRRLPRRHRRPRPHAHQHRHARRKSPTGSPASRSTKLAAASARISKSPASNRFGKIASSDRPAPSVPFQIGDVHWLGVNPCQRCVVPTRDSTSGELTAGFQKVVRQRARAASARLGPARQIQSFLPPRGKHPARGWPIAPDGFAVGETVTTRLIAIRSNLPQPRQPDRSLRLRIRHDIALRPQSSRHLLFRGGANRSARARVSAQSQLKDDFDAIRLDRDR